jgi:hypothetical protein
VTIQRGRTPTAVGDSAGWTVADVASKVPPLNDDQTTEEQEYDNSQLEPAVKCSPKEMCVLHQMNLMYLKGSCYGYHDTGGLPVHRAL